MRVESIILPCRQAEDLAHEIAGLWPLDFGGTALGIALVGGFAGANAAKPCWALSGSEFLSWRGHADGWLDAAICSFWWD